VLVVVFLLLAFGVKGCLDSRKTNALKNYNRDVTAVIKESDQSVGKPFFQLMSNAQRRASDLCSGPLAACTANVHDNTLNVENPKVEMNATADVDVNNVHAGQAVPLTIKADNVFPVAPNETPPPEHVKDAVFCRKAVEKTVRELM